MVKIAVYSISLNEILHVERYMEACKGADYIVVADTGSTDGTPEKLRELGATVYDISIKPWRFDDARNAALALVPTDADVCVILDLDEVPQPGFFDKVRKGWKSDATIGWITMDTGQTWQRDRLHNRHGWHWKYPCHEIQLYYGDNEHKIVSILDAVIKHQPDNNKSRKQYLDILKLAVREHPDDPRMWTYMCREYYFNSMWQDVIDAGKRKIELNGWDVESAAVCRWVGESYHQIGDKDNATLYYNKGVEILPHEGESHYGVAIDAYRKQEWQRCLDASLAVLDLPRSIHYCYEADVWNWKAYDLAGVSAYNLGHVEEALTFAKEAAKANGPEQERIQRNIDFMEKVINERMPARGKSNKLGTKRKV
jgi:glycosyltransferase involved in cell wall biosynthesis